MLFLNLPLIRLWASSQRVANVCSVGRGGCCGRNGDVASSSGPPARRELTIAQPELEDESTWVHLPAAGEGRVRPTPPPVLPLTQNGPPLHPPHPVPPLVSSFSYFP